MVFDSLNVQWSKKCDIDYVFVGKIAKYTKVKRQGKRLRVSVGGSMLIRSKKAMVKHGTERIGTVR